MPWHCSTPVVAKASVPFCPRCLCRQRPNQGLPCSATPLPFFHLACRPPRRSGWPLPVPAPCWRWAAALHRRSRSPQLRRALTASRCTKAVPRWSARWPWPLAHAKRCSAVCPLRWTRKACRRRATVCAWARCGWTPASALWCPNAPARRRRASAAWKTNWRASTLPPARCSCRTATCRLWPPWRQPMASPPWARPHQRKFRPPPRRCAAPWRAARCARTSCSATSARWSSACAHCSRSKAAAPMRKAG